MENILSFPLEEKDFDKYLKLFLDLLGQVAFDELGPYKIFTYAFDLRPNLYLIFEEIGYTKEAS